jgi:hypothetical protein
MQCTAQTEELSLALQRFGSEADPGVKFCCLLIAVLVLLCAVAGDDRATKEKRDRAEQLLDKFDAAYATGVGMSTDYFLETLSLILELEVDGHDPAKTHAQVRRVISELDVLFRQSLVAVPSVTHEKTMTQLVFEQLGEQRTFYYNGKYKLLYDSVSKERIQEVMGRFHLVVDSVESRLLADFAESSTEMHLDIFDLDSWDPIGGLTEIRKQARLSRVRTLSRIAGYAGPAVAEIARCFTGNMQFMLDRRRVILADDTRDKSNRDVADRDIWTWVRDPLSNAPQNSSHFSSFVELYEAMDDSTCTVERNFRDVAEALAAHSGPLDEIGETLWALEELSLDRPKSEEEICSKSEDGTLFPNDFSRQLARSWIRLHGRRFGRNIAVRSDLGKQHVRHKPGCSIVQLKRNQRMAVRSLVVRANAGILGSTPTLFADVSLSSIQAKSDRKLERSLYWTEAHTLFNTHTKRKQALADAEKVGRAQSLQRFPTIKLNTGGIAQSISQTAIPETLLSGKIAVCWASRAPQPSGPHLHRYTIRIDSLFGSPFVALDDLSVIDAPSKALDIVRQIYIIGFGKCVIPARCWSAVSPHLSPDALYHKKAVREVVRKLVVSPLVLSHETTMLAMRRCVAYPQSRWRIYDESGKDLMPHLKTPVVIKDALLKEGNVVALTCLADIVKFFRSVRRVQQGRGAAGLFLRKS